MEPGDPTPARRRALSGVSPPRRLVRRLVRRRFSKGGSLWRRWPVCSGRPAANKISSVTTPAGRTRTQDERATDADRHRFSAAVRPARMEDIGFMTCMTLVMLGNYAQTGHFGGPLAYTPYNVAAHLAGPGIGRTALRLPPSEASLWRQVHAGGGPQRSHLLCAVDDPGAGAGAQVSGDRRSPLLRDPNVAMLPIDALGFRRGAGALKTPLATRTGGSSAVCAGQSARHPRALRHIETTDLTNDVNGGPSGVGIASAAGKAAFWDIVGARMSSPKVFALEGEFAMRRRPRAGAQDAGPRAAGGQAAADLASPTTTPASTIAARRRDRRASSMATG